MPTTLDKAVERTTQRRGPAYCKPLLDAATKDLFRNNAFRITGLSVEATPREETTRADKLKLMEELGQGATLHTGAVALNPPPTLDQIRDAIKNLKNPARRLIDEFFWFWPRERGRTTLDPALEALASGNADAALQIWMANETNPTSGVVATHNIALYWQLKALDLETDNAGPDVNGPVAQQEFTSILRGACSPNPPAAAGVVASSGPHAGAGVSGGHSTGRREADRAPEEMLEKCWRNSLKRWKYLTSDDLLWDKVAARVRHIDDPQLTGFVESMRATLPDALAKLNAELALSHAEKGRTYMAKMHVQFLREGTEGPTRLEKAAELVLAPTKARLKEQINRAQERAKNNREDAASAARELLQQAQSALALYDLFFGKDNDLRNDLFDEVASACNRLQIDYYKATGDDRTCLDILKSLLPFATSTDLRQLIEKDISETRARLELSAASKKLEPVYTLLKSFQDSKESPPDRLARFERDAIPAIVKATGISSFSPHYGYLSIVPANCEDLFDCAAIVLRGISLDAWNNHQDQPTAVTANELALKHAVSPELKKRLAEDQTALRQLTQDAGWTPAEQPLPCRPQAASNLEILRANKGWLVAVAIVGIIVLTMVFAPNNPSYPPLDAPPTPPPTSSKGPGLTDADVGIDSAAASPLPSPAPTTKRTYRIPSSVSAELETANQQISIEKAKSDALDIRLATAKQAVAAQNSQVADLQSRLQTLARQIDRDRIYLDRTSQSDIDDFNAKVSRYNILRESARAENATANDLIDSYNTLLEETKAQDSVVNQLVENYNAKLRQYGR
jgi:hypothetical protein